LLRGQGVRLSRKAPVRRWRVRVVRLRLPRGADSLLHVAQLVFWNRRPGRVQERPLLPVSGALASWLSDGAYPPALDVARTYGPNHAGARLHVWRRGGVVPQRQVAGPQEKGTVRVPAPVGLGPLRARQAGGRGLSERRAVGHGRR